MKNNLTFILLVVCILLSGKIIMLSKDITFLEQKDNQINQKILDNEIKFKWSEEEKDIPQDGTLIQIKSTDENTVFIGPVGILTRPFNTKKD